MNTELKKNAEGYADPTASATLTRKEPGDIWTYKGKECLIIKGRAGSATILRLHDDDRYGDRIKVADRDDGPRYVDPAFIITGKYYDMGKYVETLDVDTFTQVIHAVEDALGIKMLQPQEADWRRTAMQDLSELEAETQALLAHRDALQKQNDFLREQLDLMTGLHEKAVDHVNSVQFEKMKVVTQLELLQVMVANVLDSFRQKTEG